MDAKRTRVYKELEKEIGGTPLIKYNGQVPNGNTIWIKRECDNPWGSHYDRVYLALFKYHEEIGNIQPGHKVLETSSGSAGVSFAGIGKRLGYECFVALPGGGEKIREKAIQEQLLSNNHLLLTPAKEYISGFPKFLKRFLPKNRDYFFLNHSMGKMNNETEEYANNEITLGALEKIAHESIYERDINFFFPAVGNGSSVLGPGRAFYEFNNISYGVIGGLMEEPSSFGMFNAEDINKAIEDIERTRTKIIPFETVQSAVLYDLKKPGEYKKEFGIEPGTLSRHKLPGTSFQGINFPHISNSLSGGIVDDVMLVTDKGMDKEYYQKTGRDSIKKLVHWDTPIDNYDDIGRTTRASINIALRVAESVGEKNMLVIGYDKAERYDS